MRILVHGPIAWLCAECEKAVLPNMRLCAPCWEKLRRELTGQHKHGAKPRILFFSRLYASPVRNIWGLPVKRKTA